MSDTSPTPELPVEMIEVTSTRTKNTLTLANQLRLADWCRQHLACTTEPYTKLAAMAAAELGFTVTAANVSSTIEACGITRIKPDAPLTLEQQIAALRDRLDKAEGDSKALRGTVEEILAGMRAMHARVERLEMHHEQPIVHPDLPRLPVPSFGAAAPTTAALPFDADVRENVDPVYGI